MNRLRSRHIDILSRKHQPWSKTLLCLAVATVSLAGFKGATRPDWWKPQDATPGAKLTIHEKSRQAHDPHFHGHASVVVNIAVSGFPEDKDYELWSSSLDGFTARLLQLRVNKAGEMEELSPPQNRKPLLLKRLSFHLGSFAKGEPASYALVSTDRTVKAFAEFIPFPIEAAQGTCRIRLQLVTPDGKAFFVEGEGFEPGEEVATISRSDGETIPAKARVAQDGSLPPLYLLPAAKRRRHKASYTVTGKSCSVTVDYKWGPPALEKQ